MHRYKDLEIWKRIRLFCKDIYEATVKFPSLEKFGLINQLRRASISIPSNIADGASRRSNKGFSRFLEISIGSCYEIETQLMLSNDLGFLNNKEFNELMGKIEIIIKMTSKFKSTLK